MRRGIACIEVASALATKATDALVEALEIDSCGCSSTTWNGPRTPATSSWMESPRSRASRRPRAPTGDARNHATRDSPRAPGGSRRMRAERPGFGIATHTSVQALLRQWKWT
ncbi:MAG: hypothetical protein ACKOEQ_06075, partial [Verrucomicrobiota bacterium]